MSIKTKKRLKNLGKILGVLLFAALMFSNIKIAFIDNPENLNNAISILDIEFQLFEPTYAECPAGPCSQPGNYSVWNPVDPNCNCPTSWEDADCDCTFW